MVNLALLLEDSAREVPARTALICGETRLSYAEVHAASSQVAHGLVQAGIHTGDTVALSCQNVPSFVIAYDGILKAGAAVMPLNILLKPREIAFHLTDGDAKAYFCQEGTPELPMGQMGYTAFQEVESCQHFVVMPNEFDAPSSIPGATTLGMLMRDQPTTFESVATSPDDTAVILSTSGTTGKPKGSRTDPPESAPLSIAWTAKPGQDQSVFPCGVSMCAWWMQTTRTWRVAKWGRSLFVDTTS